MRNGFVGEIDSCLAQSAKAIRGGSPHGWVIGFAALLAICGGCRSTEPFGLWYGPHARSDTQRAQAQVIDPYPDPNIGPPVEGGRPLDYQNPRSAPQRTQPDRWIRGFGQ